MKNQKKLITSAGLTALLALCAGAAQADSQAEFKTPYYLAPFGSYLHPGGDSHGLDGWGAGAAVGKVLNEHFNVEARGFWQNYRIDLPCCSGENDVYGATLDGQYYFTRSFFSPYLVAGIGGMVTDVNSTLGNGSESSFIFEAGAGSTYQLTSNLLIRGDVRYRLNTLPNEANDTGVLNDLVVNLGLVVNLF